MNFIKYIREIIILVVVLVACSFGAFAYIEYNRNKRLNAEIEQTKQQIEDTNKKLLEIETRNKNLIKERDKLERDYQKALAEKQKAIDAFNNSSEEEYDEWLKNFVD